MNLRKHLWRVGLAWLACVAILSVTGSLHLSPTRSAAPDAGAEEVVSHAATDPLMARMVQPTLAAYVPNAAPFETPSRYGSASGLRRSA